MSLIDAGNNVAVLVDYENIAISYREKHGSESEVNWKSLLEMAAKYGRVVIRKAYADWSEHEEHQRELLSLGFQLENIATKKRGRNVADIKLVIDAVDMFIVRDSGVKCLLLMSGDGDFTDLVHYLRANGKFVLGIGIMGASAEYLINACDEFKYYETIDTPVDVGASHKESVQLPETSFDLSEARQLLRKVLDTGGGDWMGGGKVKAQMQRINPDFDERNYRFERFLDFLAAQKDLVETRYHHSGGHLEVRLVRIDPGQQARETPETLVDDYLRVLAKNKITMTPSVLRFPVLKSIYELVKTMTGFSFVKMREGIYREFDEKYPEVKVGLVKEVVHQMYMSYCLEIERNGKKYPPGTTTWDRDARLDPAIRSLDDFIGRIDRHLLTAIQKGIEPRRVDPDAALRVLYGTTGLQQLREHVDRILQSLAPPPS